MSEPLPCIVCGVQLSNAGMDRDGWNNQPHDGVAFESHGHWGSTFFDPGHSSLWIEITVCDVCLAERPERLAYTESPPPNSRVRIAAESVGNPEAQRRRRRPRAKDIGRRLSEEGNQ